MNDNLSRATRLIDPGSPPVKTTTELGTGDLVGGILADTRELVGAHAERLRDELTADLRDLGAVLRATMLAGAAGMVATTMVGIAITVTLVALGLPAWAAAWIVVILAGILAGVFIQKLRATSVKDHVIDELKAARDDVAWAGERTVQAIEGASAVTAAPPPSIP